MKVVTNITSLPIRLIYWLLLRRVHVGEIAVDLNDGRHRLVGKGDNLGPVTTLSVHKPTKLLWRVVRGGGVGFAEAYLAGEWDTADLPTALENLGRNLDVHVRDNKPGWLIPRLRRIWQAITHRRSSEIPSIGDHYNLGNEFYTAWLDKTMTYSSAVFTDGDETLSEAQLEKYRRLAELADIGPDDRVLEIGCGWGGFAEFAASEIGCHVTGLTLSTEQAEYARNRLKEAGLDDKTEIRLRDFREETGTYDKIVSIEMIESIPAELWPALFETISANLRDGGRVAMQAITIADDLYESLLERDDYISKHIFPGGALPSVAEVHSLADRFGLKVTSAVPYASSYAATLQRWRESFEASWQTMRRDDLDERFRRAWRYYLAYCEAGFRIGRIDVHQVGFSG